MAASSSRSATLTYREFLSDDSEADLGSDWSKWILAMVPNERVGYTKRKDGEGYTLPKSSLVGQFNSHKSNHTCGLYEWKARKGGGSYVVYVGSTCRYPCDTHKSGDIADRVYQYCSTGSHKKEKINEALRQGYELYVRFRVTVADKEESEKEENAILRRVTYAWNIRYPNPAPRLVGDKI